MRTIKFRGKTIDNGEWVYGYYIKLPHPLTAFLKDYIVISGFDDKRENGYQDFILVEPETVCQFTGLHDKNGIEIYEGDKLVITQSFQVLDGEVIYHEDTACYRLKIDEDEQEALWYLPKEMEVIGNIHEEEMK